MVKKQKEGQFGCSLMNKVIRDIDRDMRSKRIGILFLEHLETTGGF